MSAAVGLQKREAQSNLVSAEGSDFGDQVRLSGANWIMNRSGDFVEVVYFVGVPDGI